ncbi:MAG: MaoC family dehydratase N-terminal domain-containing protein [Fimbriimonadaceae bacterium]|nr:MaoC family dehydratase N-terminal domain-containing protein [Alphaproteobacteria bacterium]
MNMNMQGHIFAPFTLMPDKNLAEQFLLGQGVSGELSDVPPTYMIFLRGEKRGVNLFEALDIPRQKALHGGQRYDWIQPIKWGEEYTVSVTIETIVEKDGRSGKIWFADVLFHYYDSEGEIALREKTSIIERA